MATRALLVIAAAVVLSRCAVAVTVAPTPQTSFTSTISASSAKPPFIPLSSLAKTVPGCAPEQVKLTVWSTTSKSANILVSWAACDIEYNDAVTGPLTPPKAKPEVWVSETVNGKYKAHKGHATSYIIDSTSSGGSIYRSPIFNHVLVKGLKHGTTYQYKIPDTTASMRSAASGRRLLQDAAPPRGLDDGASDDGGGNNSGDARGAASPRAEPDWGANPFVGTIQVPPATFPLKIGIWGDPGQLVNETLIVDAFKTSDVDAFWIMGDIAYGDNNENFDYYPPGACVGLEKACDLACAAANPYIAYAYYGPYKCWTTISYGPRWDAWGRLASTLLSSRPATFTNGNHEIEMLPKYSVSYNYTSRALNYNARYPVPQKKAPPKKFSPITLKDTTHNMYSAVEYAGVAKVVQITSYIVNDTFTPNTKQYKFFKRELKNTNRKRTPWLVVVMHAPFYTSLTKHFKEAECMRQYYEPLMLEYGVDLVVNGHNHAYERINPVYNYTTTGQACVGKQCFSSACFAAHFTLGGGCADDVTIGYVDVQRNDPPESDGEGPSTYCNATLGGAAMFESFKDTLPIYQKPICNTTAIPIPGGLLGFCPSAQPEYSRFRESGFGRAELTFDSATSATWTYYRVDAPSVVADQVTITRDPAACGLKQ